MQKIEISAEHARHIKRMLEEFRDIDSRARCSDAFFRQHFQMLVSKNPWMKDAETEIGEKLNNLNNSQA